MTKGHIATLALLLASTAQAQYWSAQPSQTAEIQRQQLESQQRTEAMTREILDEQQRQRRQRDQDELDQLREENAVRHARVQRIHACVLWATTPPATLEKARVRCSDVK